MDGSNTYCFLIRLHYSIRPARVCWLLSLSKYFIRSILNQYTREPLRRATYNTLYPAIAPFNLGVAIPAAHGMTYQRRAKVKGCHLWVGLFLEQWIERVILSPDLTPRSSRR